MGLFDIFNKKKSNNIRYKTQKIKSVKLSWNNINFELNANSKYLTAYYRLPQKDRYNLQGLPNMQRLPLDESEFNTYISQVRRCLEKINFYEGLPVLSLPGAFYDAYMWCKYDSKNLYYTNTFSEGFSLRNDPVNEEFVQLYNILKAKLDSYNHQLLIASQAAIKEPK